MTRILTVRGGYDYGVKTHYSDRHLGVDWKSNYINLPAPKRVKILKTIPESQAPQGGNTLWFQPIGENVIIRWLHLDKFYCQAGKIYDEGVFIAKSGNTGLSDIPHTHEDIWKSAVTLEFEDTINPHTYWANKINKGDMFRAYKGTIYGLLAGYWIAVATSYDEFLSDWGNLETPEMTKAQFEAFPVNKRTIK